MAYQRTISDSAHLTPKSSFSQNLSELLYTRAHSSSSKGGYHFLTSTKREFIPWSVIYKKAKALGDSICRFVSPGSRVVIANTTGQNYIVSVFACILTRTVAVPLYPPLGKRHRSSFDAVIDAVRPDLILSAADIDMPEEIVLDLKLRQVISSDDGITGFLVEGYENPERVVQSLDDVALLQMTSGSASSPKGVIQTHRSILHNLIIQKDLYNISASARAVIWLPLHHDMGLGAGVFQPLYSDSEILLLDAKQAIKSPSVWLRWIDEFNATVSGAPPFCYELCVKERAMRPELYECLSLESWETAIVGAEPISIKTLQRFGRAFEPHGFNMASFVPSYGLAEATVLVCGRRGVPSSESYDGVMRVSCGNPSKYLNVVIVDNKTKTVLPEREHGEIWVQGSSVANGYWQDELMSDGVFNSFLHDGQGPYLRTGDIGFMSDDELFIIGRQKNIFIAYGRNIQLEDVDSVVRQVLAPMLNDVTVVSVAFQKLETDNLGIGVEVPTSILNDEEKVEPLSALVLAAVVEKFDVRPDFIFFERQGLFPRTSSGKVKRFACAEMFLRKLKEERV